MWCKLTQWMTTARFCCQLHTVVAAVQLTAEHLASRWPRDPPEHVCAIKWSVTVMAPLAVVASLHQHQTEVPLSISTAKHVLAPNPWANHEISYHSSSHHSLVVKETSRVNNVQPCHTKVGSQGVTLSHNVGSHGATLSHKGGSQGVTLPPRTLSHKAE